MPVRSIIEIPLNQSLFVELEIAKYLRVDANLNTVGIDSVHLKSNSQIAYKLVADLNARTKK
jgi:hypothetical protein